MSETNIELLALQLQTQNEKLAEIQRVHDRSRGDIYSQIDKLKGAQNRLEGAESARDKATSAAQKWGPLIIGLAASLVGSWVFGSLKEDIRTNGSDIRANAVEIQEDKIEIARRFERKDQRVIALQKQMDTHEEMASHMESIPVIATILTRLDGVEKRAWGIKVPSLGSIRITLENVNTRLAAIEDELTADTGKFEDLTSDVVALKADARALTAVGTEHEEEIDALEDRVATMSEDLSSVRASTGAAFVEVETQIRGLTDVMNTVESYTRQWMQKIYLEMGKQMPENDFFPSEIPAKATTTVGKINGG